jgi:hypothetical protein
MVVETHCPSDIQGVGLDRRSKDLFQSVRSQKYINFLITLRLLWCGYGETDELKLRAPRSRRNGDIEQSKASVASSKGRQLCATKSASRHAQEQHDLLTKHDDALSSSSSRMYCLARLHCTTWFLPPRVADSSAPNQSPMSPACHIPGRSQAVKRPLRGRLTLGCSNERPGEWGCGNNAERKA